ncbi:MAG: DNA polymerase III subunit epsilon [Gammaproteobacteria bacterium]
MRQIVLDTETTGLEPSQGHRIIEIGCVELNNRRKTENYFHEYLNPQREVADGAYNVHGISREFLTDKPLFKDIARDFIDFVRGSEVIIHNAPFDLAFINAELTQLGSDWGMLEDYCSVIDTLKLARERHPGQKNSLDALCSRYGVDNSQRDVHGALLDAQILVDVYLAMTGGQARLFPGDSPASAAIAANSYLPVDPDRPPLKLIQPDEEELRAHRKRLQDIDKESGGNCIWNKKLSNS